MEKKAKTKRRLKNIRVDEISLVDKGAVQDADFVILSKRVEEQPEETTETEVQESEILQLAKAMTESETFDAAHLLHMMSEFTHLMKAMKETKSRLSEELQSAFENLKSVMFSGDVEKRDGDSEQLEELEKMVSELKETVSSLTVKKTEETETETVETTEVVQKKDILEEVAELLQKRREDDSTADAQKVLDALNGFSGKFEKFEAECNTRHEELESRLNSAMGKG